MNQIKTGAIISYVALFLNIVIGLLYTPWMINTIGKADYGLYTWLCLLFRSLCLILDLEVQLQDLYRSTWQRIDKIWLILC